MDYDRNIILAQLNMLQNRVNQQTQAIEDQNQRINELTQQIDLLNHSVNCQYHGSNKGIVQYFKFHEYQFTLSNGGAKNQNYPIINITNDNNNFFSNYMYYTSNTSLNDAYILFNFQDKKIVLNSYLIRTNFTEPNTWYHPKSWRIEGSNDNINWNAIDRQVNNLDLNGQRKYKNFEIHNIQDVGYQYIKYIQDECYCNGPNPNPNQCNICIEYFELFGKIIFQ